VQIGHSVAGLRTSCSDWAFSCWSDKHRTQDWALIRVLGDEKPIFSGIAVLEAAQNFTTKLGCAMRRLFFSLTLLSRSTYLSWQS